MCCSPLRRHRATSLVAIVAVLAIGATGCLGLEPPGWRSVKITGFTPVESHPVWSLSSDQGSATVRPATGGHYVVYAGEQVDPALSKAGWTHDGDPDSRQGYVVFPYQSNDAAQGKMYQVVTPQRKVYQYVHKLVAGEESNDSFAAISPSGQWLVSGEWDTESRFLVFPMPVLNQAVPAGNGPLMLASTIELDKPLTDIQGCAFASATRLICSSDDAKKELLAVELSAPVSGTTVHGTVTSLGRLPLISTCKGTFEAEGVDFDLVSRTLRVGVIPPSPCFIDTDVYEYRPTR